ncbi:hypothetical protein Tco_1166583 [Tanacetum coccineum]
MAEMFGLLKELTASQTSKKVLVSEEARHLITKNVNSIYLIRVEEEKNVGNNGAIGESVVEPSKSEEEKTLKEVDVMNEVERRADDKPAKSVRENVTKNEEEEPVGVSSSHALTDERHAGTDIRLSLASHSYIYPLGIAEDVLVDVVGRKAHLLEDKQMSSVGALGWHLEEMHVTWASFGEETDKTTPNPLKKLCTQGVETASRLLSDGVRIFIVTVSQIWRRRQNVADLKWT